MILSGLTQQNVPLADFAEKRRKYNLILRKSALSERKNKFLRKSYEAMKNFQIFFQDGQSYHRTIRPIAG